MIEESRSFAPYNFIPFSQKTVPQPYKNSEELPFFNWENGISGRIEYKIHNYTRLFVGCHRPKKNGKDAGDKIARAYFCKNGEGDYIIPGSTVRGLIKRHAEILSASMPESVENERFMYRKFADRCVRLRKQYTYKLVGINSNGLGLLQDVKAGYIYKKKTNGTLQYFIRPVKDFKGTKTSFLKVHENVLRRANILDDKNKYMFTEEINDLPWKTKEMDPYERRQYSFYLRERENRSYRPYRGPEVAFDCAAEKVRNIGKGSLQGILLNSEYISGKKHHYIVSTEKSDISKEIPVSIDDAQAYNRDYERNCVQNTRLARNREFYALPDKEGEENGKLFFYKVDSRLGVGSSKLIGFGPTPYFRIFYDYSVKTGIKRLEGTGYDYASALFGFIGKSHSYKSRLSFGHCVIACKNACAESKPVELYAASPKGSAFQMYLDQTGKDARNLTTYNDKDMMLRGYKFYWKRSEDDTSGIIKHNTEFFALSAGQDFIGEIYFKNLSEDELGLLLLSLQCEDEPGRESYQIGMGKPYGFGKIGIEILNVVSFDARQRFTHVNAEENDIKEKIPKFKQAFIKKLKEYGIDFQNDSGIKLYRAIARLNDNDEYFKNHSGTYMDFKGYKNRYPLPTAEEILYVWRREKMQ